MMHYKEEPSRPKIQHVMLPYCNGRNQIPCYPSTLEVFQGAQSCLNLFCFPSNKLPVLYCICADNFVRLFIGELFITMSGTNQSRSRNPASILFNMRCIKFLHFEKAIKFCEIFP